MKIHRSIPHGNVAAVLGTMRNIGLDQFIAARPCRERSLIMAMIADRIISPGSKLSCATGMNPETVQNTLAQELQLGEVDVHELYDAMDWLLERQTRIDEDLRDVEGLEWISPLRSDEIRKRGVELQEPCEGRARVSKCEVD